MLIQAPRKQLTILCDKETVLLPSLLSKYDLHLQLLIACHTASNIEHPGVKAIHIGTRDTDNGTLVATLGTLHVLIPVTAREW